MVQHHESLSRTAMQQAMEIMSMKRVVESMGPSYQKLKDAQLAVELGKLGCKSVVGGRRKDDDDGSGLTANVLMLATHISKNVLVYPSCVAVLLQMESEFGSRSPFHKMGALGVLAKKPSSKAMREWSLHSLMDGLTYGILQLSQVTMGTLQGDKHHVGLIQLYEMKSKAPRQNVIITII